MACWPLSMNPLTLMIVLLLRSVPLRGLVLSMLFARRLLLLWPAVLLAVLVGVLSLTRRSLVCVVLSLLPVRLLGLLLVLVGMASLLVVLLSSVLLRAMVLLLLSARRLLLLWPAVLLSALVGVMSLPRRLLAWPVVLLSVLIGVT